MCVAECDWHIGMLDRRCVKPLPSSLPSVTNIEKGKQLLCAHTRTHTQKHNTTPTFSISFYLCQLSEGLLGQLSVSVWPAFTPTTDSCPDMPSVSPCLFAFTHQRQSLCLFFPFFFFLSYCYPPFTHHLRAQCLFSSFQDPVCLCWCRKTCVIR